MMCLTEVLQFTFMRAYLNKIGWWITLVSLWVTAIAPLTAHANSSGSTPEQALSMQLLSYSALVDSIAAWEETYTEGEEKKIEDARKQQMMAQLAHAEDDIIATLPTIKAADRAGALDIIADARFRLDHRDPIPIAEEAIAVNSPKAPLMALDLGQLWKANQLANKLHTPEVKKIRAQIARVKTTIQADSPDWRCSTGATAICTGLYALLGTPSFREGRLVSLPGNHRNNDVRIAGDPRKTNRRHVAAVMLTDSPPSIPFPDATTVSITAWKIGRVAPRTTLRLNQLTSDGRASIMAQAGAIIDVLISDEALARVFSKDTKLQNGAAGGPTSMSDHALYVTLHDSFMIGERRFLALKLDAFLRGKIIVLEIPPVGVSQMWYSASDAQSGGIYYATGTLGGSANPLVFVHKTETTDGNLSLWILDPAHRRTTRVFDEDEAYHGTYFTFDMEGKGIHRLSISRATGDRRYEDCNQCPSRIQNLIFSFNPHNGTLRLLSNHVSWTDLSFGTRANLMGLGPEVSQYGNAAEIQAGLAKLALITVGNGDMFGSAAAQLAYTIRNLYDSTAYAEAISSADELLDLMATKPGEFEGRNDIIQFVSITAAQAHLRSGAVATVEKYLRSLDPDRSANPQIRAAIIDLRLQFALARGGMSDYFAALKVLFARDPDDPDTLARLANYLLQVGNYEEALRVARLASDRRMLTNQDWTDDLYIQAIALTRLERYESAITTLSELLRRSAGSTESNISAKAMLTASDIAIRTGNYDAARHLLDAGLARMNATAWNEESPAALMLYGRLLGATKRPESAIRALNTSAKVVNRNGPLWGVLQDEMAGIYQLLGKQDEATSLSNQAFDTVLALQRTVAEEPHKLSFVSSSAEIANRYFSRLLNEPHIDPVRLVDALESWRAQVLRSLRRESSRQVRPTPSGADAIRSLARHGVAYVSYLLDRRHPVAIVAEDGQIRVLPLKMDQDDMEAARKTVQAYMDIRNPEALENIWLDTVPISLQTVLNQLHQKLIDDLGLDQQTTTIVVVPDENMFWIPWPALAGTAKSGGLSMLFERFTVLLTPSVLMIDGSAQPLPPQSYMAIASIGEVEASAVRAALPDMYLTVSPIALPVLESGREEVMDLTRTLGKTMRGNSLFIPPPEGDLHKWELREILAAMSSASIVHVAAHGIFNSITPMESVIFLSTQSGNGVLRPLDLASADLSKVELISLSACQTGVSNVRGGGEAIGFVRGLMEGGAKRILLANWSVEDRATQYFFKTLYSRIAGGSPYAEAYRDAVLDSVKRYRHPFYWSGFAMYNNVLH